MIKDRLDCRIEIRMTSHQARMLQWLAAKQQRSMGSVMRLAIERAYHTEQQREADAAGRASSSGRAIGRST